MSKNPWQEAPSEENYHSPIQEVINNRENQFIKNITNNAIVFKKLPVHFKSQEGSANIVNILNPFHQDYYPPQFLSKKTRGPDTKLIEGYQTGCAEYHVYFKYNFFGFAPVDNVQLAIALNKCNVISQETLTKVAITCIQWATEYKRRDLESLEFPTTHSLDGTLITHLNTITSSLEIPDKRIIEEVFSPSERQSAQSIQESLATAQQSISAEKYPELHSALAIISRYTKKALAYDENKKPENEQKFSDLIRKQNHLEKLAHGV